MISTRDNDGLPDVEGLRRLLQSMAVLDAIICPEWSYRYYSFNSRWASGEQMGSMRNGSGDEFFALFNAAGCFLKGLAHESPMALGGRGPGQVWPGVLDGVPEVFGTCLAEPAFSMADTTFCLWRRPGDDSWRLGPVSFPPGQDPDGSEGLLSPLDGEPETYRAWAEDYYEREIPLAGVGHIYSHGPLTLALISSLNPDLAPEDLRADVDEIGYPGGLAT